VFIREDDQNRDGMIDFDEFKSFWEDVWTSTEINLSLRRVKSADEDNSGTP
jgi:hypothetical protein